jgi:hypothetical protein
MMDAHYLMAEEDCIVNTIFYCSSCFVAMMKPSSRQSLAYYWGHVSTTKCLGGSRCVVSILEGNIQ